MAFKADGWVGSWTSKSLSFSQCLQFYNVWKLTPCKPLLIVALSIAVPEHSSKAIFICDAHKIFTTQFLFFGYAWNSCRKFRAHKINNKQIELEFCSYFCHFIRDFYHQFSAFICVIANQELFRKIEKLRFHFISFLVVKFGFYCVLFCMCWYVLVSLTP